VELALGGGFGGFSMARQVSLDPPENLLPFYRGNGFLLRCAIRRIDHS